MGDYSEMTVEEVKENIGSFSVGELNSMLSDERVGVQEAARAELDSRASSAEVPAPGETPNVDPEPWKNPGPPRREDQVAPAEEGAPLSAEEVDLESQRVDETSSLAHDRYDGETGKRIE